MMLLFIPNKNWFYPKKGKDQPQKAICRVFQINGRIFFILHNEFYIKQQFKDIDFDYRIRY